MAQSFDIRFARSAGLAGLFEAPSNSFRWIGTGRLSIDAQGISIAVSNGVLSLLARKRARRIPTTDLKEIFREGDALRVDFASGERARGSLRFWARDRDTAAQIVQLLPLSRTVELEDAAAASKFQFNRPVLAVTGVTIAMLVGVTSWLIPPVAPPQRELIATTPLAPAVGSVDSLPSRETPTLARASNTESKKWDAAVGTIQPAAEVIPLPTQSPRSVPSPTPDLSQPDARTPSTHRELTEPPTEEFVPDQLPEIELAPPNSVAAAPRVQSSAETNVLPIQKNTPAWNEALRQLAIFGSESDDLLAEFEVDYQLLLAGRISRVDLATKLPAYERRWWAVTNRILEERAFADPALVDLRATLLACARYRRSFLTHYSAGLRRNDSQLIKRAFTEQERASELNARARRYIG